jgi:hypothetical protein
MIEVSGKPKLFSALFFAFWATFLSFFFAFVAKRV